MLSKKIARADEEDEKHLVAIRARADISDLSWSCRARGFRRRSRGSPIAMTFSKLATGMVQFLLRRRSPRRGRG